MEICNSRFNEFDAIRSWRLPTDPQPAEHNLQQPTVRTLNISPEEKLSICMAAYGPGLFCVHIDRYPGSQGMLKMLHGAWRTRS